MLDTLRKPFFVLALVLLALAVLLEMGSSLVVGSTLTNQSSAFAEQAEGWGVQSIALLDALLVLTVGLMGASLLLPEGLHGRVQGLVTLVVSLLVLLGALFMLFMGLQLLGVMLGLFLAPPFGTIAYLAIWGGFDRPAAAAILALLLLLKLGFAACLVLAQQRFLQNKGLVLMIATSVLMGLLLAFLHGFVPKPLASITDLVGAIVVAVITLVWAIIFLIGAVIAVVKAIA